jgi:Cu+-exporting ATPase
MGAGEPARAIDPVCGMSVDPTTAKHRAEHRGSVRYFCSARCHAKFTADPERYLKPAAPATPAQVGSAEGIYTCPMHPQIRQRGPGSCPICGMALEPVEVEPSGRSPELIDMTRRFWIGAALAVPLVLLDMGMDVPGLNLHHYISPMVSIWVQFALATPVVLWVARPFFARAFASVRNRSLNMFSLISLGVGAAYLYSLMVTFAPWLIPTSLRQADGTIPVYYEASRCRSTSNRAPS